MSDSESDNESRSESGSDTEFTFSKKSSNISPVINIGGLIKHDIYDEDIDIDIDDEDEDDVDELEDVDDLDETDRVKKLIGGAKDDETIGDSDEDSNQDNSDDEENSDKEDDDDKEGPSSSIKKNKENKPKNQPLQFQYDDDDEDEDDENYLQKFDTEIIKNYVTEFHPECASHNYEEIEKLTIVVRNEDGIIIDSLHKTIPYLTKYEKARILGQRAKQIETGAKPLVKVPENIVDSYIIAELELKEKKIPFIIRRPIPNGGCEYWRLKDLETIGF